jgi:hypothetical protein
MFYWQFHNNTF